jgi:hypothetical protein
MSFDMERREGETDEEYNKRIKRYKAHPIESKMELCDNCHQYRMLPNGGPCMNCGHGPKIG